MRQFETKQEEHLIPTVVNVVDSPNSIYSVCYDTFKEYFVKEGYVGIDFGFQISNLVLN